MKVETIYKIVKEFLPESDGTVNNIAVAIKQALDQQVKIKVRIRDHQKDAHDIETKYKKQLDELEHQLQSIRQDCPHLETTFYGDASGGNDSETRCDLCDKQLIH